MIDSIVVSCCHLVLIYLVMYCGDKVLGHLSSLCPVHLLAYGVPKVFPVVKACQYSAIYWESCLTIMSNILFLVVVLLSLIYMPFSVF